MKVLVGIPTYNGAQRVDWLLQSISMRTGKNIDYKIVVCDDSGKESHQKKTRSVVEKWSSHIPVELIVNDKNIGVPSSWNRLTKSHDSRHVVLINDDIIVAKDWLENMAYFLDNNPNAALVGQYAYVINESDVPQLLSSPDAIVKPRHPLTRVQTNDFDTTYDSRDNTKDITVPERTMAAIGCFFGYRRDMYNMVGGFDENFYAFYEEADFGTATASHGYPSYVLQCPKNWHIWSATFGHAPEINPGSVMTKSREYYTKKWNGHCEVTHQRYMSKIPFQKVKWLCKGKEYEELVKGMYGF